MTGNKPIVFKFADVEVREREFRLVKGEEVLAVEPKTFRVLLFLLRNPQKLITKEELLNAVWGDAAVTESSLTRTIAQLRRLLGDEIRNPHYIETVATVGYRFLHKVEVIDEAGELQATDKANSLSDGDSFGKFANGEIAKTAPDSKAPIDELAGKIEKRGEPVTGLNRRAFVWTASAAVVAGSGVWLAESFRKKTTLGVINVAIPLPQGTAAADPGRLLGPPAVAPDGSAVIVSLETTEGSYLFIRRLDSDRLVRMEGTKSGYAPFWSPDSQQVGFFADAKLKRMPVVGGSAVALCDAPEDRGGAWGRGGVIIFGLNRQSIFQVSVSGGKLTPVTQLDKAAGENSQRYPVFLPDGNRFLYFSRTDDLDQRGIYLESLDHKYAKRRILIADGQFALGHDPESKTYYLLSQQAGKIAAQNFDVDRGELSGASHVLLDRAGTISVSDTGVLVIRTDDQQLSRLVWLDRTGHELGTLGSPTDYWSVNLSPDGKFALAIKHDYLSGQFKIWIASLSTGLLEPFSDSTHPLGPIWSRDSSTVYYTDFRQKRLLRRTVSPRGPEEVISETDPAKFTYIADISPDQRYMVAEFSADDAHFEAGWTDLKADLKTNSKWHLIGASGPEGLLPSFSPDGKWLAFASNQTGDSEIYLMDFPVGAQRRRISTNGGRQPRWRRDGKELFYLAGDGSMMSVAISGAGEVQTEPPKRLFHANLRVDDNKALYDVSGDGQRFLIIAGDVPNRESDIEMVLNWPGILHQ